MIYQALKDGKVKNVELSSGYVYNRGLLDRLADRGSPCLVAGYNWSVYFNGSSVVLVYSIRSFRIGRFGADCYFGGFIHTYEYIGDINRSALLRWLYGLGLSPRDCAKIADTVFYCF